ncbi:hypothetical protein HF086_006277 [Spodoptera exigua]|uniref:Uncharacterized protein n=1 Tax=Spodoptera exigua TaxID=7107 RepID=A0A922S9K5_SPOEX|nr:hypothetical protein HF086_006277 [Spodoptera exigua]
MEEDEDDECLPEESIKEECPPKRDHLCPPRDIDPCTLLGGGSKKRKGKSRANPNCDDEETCADVPAIPDQKERLKREHLELCKAAKQPTCGETAKRKSKDPC